jgi:hypothetical protein
MPTTESQAVESTTWDIEVEVDSDGTSVEVTGSFLFRDGTVCFRVDSSEDYEFEVTELEDYEEGQEPSREDIERIRAHVQSAVQEKLEREIELKVDAAEYDAADEAYHRKVGSLRYHGMNPHDF